MYTSDEFSSSTSQLERPTHHVYIVYRCTKNTQGLQYHSQEGFLYIFHFVDDDDCFLRAPRQHELQLPLKVLAQVEKKHSKGKLHTRDHTFQFDPFFFLTHFQNQTRLSSQSGPKTSSANQLEPSLPNLGRPLQPVPILTVVHTQHIRVFIRLDLRLNFGYRTWCTRRGHW